MRQATFEQGSGEAPQVMEMDEAVGAIVSAFQTTGLYNNSVFILSADNGGILPGG